MKTMYRLTIKQRVNGQSWGEEIILDFTNKADAWRTICDMEVGEYAKHNTVFTLEKVVINEKDNNAPGNGDGGQTE